jgi:cob(I)alamin adenosyltransferase
MEERDPVDRSEAHRLRMARKKAVVDNKIAQADRQRGVIVVATGNGKGKSTSGEEAFFRRFPEVRYHVMGEGYTWETQDRDRDIEKARAAWDKAAEMLRDARIDLVFLDELNIVLKLGYLPVSQVVETLQQRPPMQHVVITGRGAPPELVEAADTVTEMRPIKHAFDAGVRAQKGVEL